MAKKNQFNGELIHFTGTRLRVTGLGNLELYLRSLDDINNVQLTDIPMSSATNREPFVLANFIDQRGQLEVLTDTIDETFVIDKIVIYIKPIATGYPQ